MTKYKELKSRVINSSIIEEDLHIAQEMNDVYTDDLLSYEEAIEIQDMLNGLLPRS